MAKKSAAKKAKPATSESASEFDDTAGVTSLIAQMAHLMTSVLEAIRARKRGHSTLVVERPLSGEGGI